MPAGLNIAIIGAGMGGLASTAALRKAGHTVAVYEQAREFTRLGAGIQIGCNAMHVLRGLGLERHLRAETFYPRSWNNRDWQSGELHAALASIVPDELVRRDHRLTGLDQANDGVRLVFANFNSVIADAVI